MPTSRDLKRKLKASAKRRSKRLCGASPSEPAAAPPEPDLAPLDVTGLIVTTLLEEARFPPQLRDEVVFAALRGCSQRTVPGNDRARKLTIRLSEIRAQNSISEQVFRKKIDEMLALARSQNGNGEVDPFLRLLKVLAQ